MVTAVEDMPRSANRTFLRTAAQMAKRAGKKPVPEDAGEEEGGGEGGRPPHSEVEPWQIKGMIETLTAAIDQLEQAVAFMDEHQMKEVTLPWTTNSKRSTALLTFAKKAHAEVGEQHYSKKMGVDSPIAANRARYEKYQKGRKP